MSRLSLYIACLSGLVFTISANAQNEASAEFWTGPEVNIEATDDIVISGSLEMRSSNDELPLINSVFTQAGASYRINKFFKVKADLRYYFHENVGPRYNVDFVARVKEKPFIFTYRGRYQTSYQQLKFNENNGLYGRGTYVRNKFGLKLDLDMAITPYTGVDFFYALGGGNANELNDKGYNGLRFSLGLEYKFENDNEIKVGYNYEAEGYGSPFKNHIMVVYYSFNFNKPKKKDKTG